MKRNTHKMYFAQGKHETIIDGYRGNQQRCNAPL